MTGRDRIVIIVLAALAVLAAVWLLAVAPEREKVSKLGGEVSAARAQLDHRRRPGGQRPRRAGAATRPRTPRS